MKKKSQHEPYWHQNSDNLTKQNPLIYSQMIIYVHKWSIFYHYCRKPFKYNASRKNVTLSRHSINYGSPHCHNVSNVNDKGTKKNNRQKKRKKLRTWTSSFKAQVLTLLCMRAALMCAWLCRYWNRAFSVAIEPSTETHGCVSLISNAHRSRNSIFETLRQWFVFRTF